MADKVTTKTTYDISYNQSNPNVNKLIKKTFEDITQKDIKVGFIDPNKGYVIDVSICEANDYAKLNPGTKFIFRDGDNNINYLGINDINNLTPDNLKPKGTCDGLQAPKTCNVPPTIQILGGGGVGAAANPVIGTDGSLLAIDLVHGGYGYQYAPQININDLCKIGSGAVATATLGNIVDVEETYENEIEDYEICEPNDPGYGNVYGPNGEDLGAWDPDIYINSGKSSIVAEIQKYQQNLLKYKNPFWTTRKFKPSSIVAPDKKNYVQAYSVDYPAAWNQFMNDYAISPVPPSNVPGSDNAGKLFIMQWDVEFPYDGEYIFRGLCDNFAKLYIDNLPVSDLAAFNGAVTPLQKTIKKGIHKIRVDLLNAPIKELVTKSTKVIPPKQPPAAPPPELIDMLRFYTSDFSGPALATHFYASDPNNEFIRENNFILEGTAFKLFKNTSNVPGTVDVYRLFNGPIGDHLFTIDGAEKGSAVLGGYNYEGVVGKAYSQPGPDRIEVVRYFKPSTGEHFYVTDAEEMKNLGAQGYVKEFTAFYAPTAAPTVATVAPVATPDTTTTQSPIKNVSVFNTIDYISKANRTLWRINPSAGAGSGFLNQYGILPFDPNSSPLIPDTEINLTAPVPIFGNAKKIYYGKDSSGEFFISVPPTNGQPVSRNNTPGKASITVDANSPEGKSITQEILNQKNTKFAPSAQSESYAGTHTIIWDNINFPADGEYIVRIAVDDNVTLHIGNTTIRKEGFFPGTSTGTGDLSEPHYFKAGNYKIRAELEQIKGTALSRGNPMVLAVDIQTSYITQEIISAKSWNQNPMGVSLTIDAPEPPVPQEKPLVQEGRCPPNPFWTTRLPNSSEKWYPVRYIVSSPPTSTTPTTSAAPPVSLVADTEITLTQSISIFGGAKKIYYGVDSQGEFFTNLPPSNGRTVTRIDVTGVKSSITVDANSTEGQSIKNQISNQKTINFTSSPQSVLSSPWSKFMNEYAISPTKPLDTPGSDKAGITYTNSWEIDIPYDGKYGVRGTVDNTGRVLIDGKEVHKLEGFNVGSPKTTKVDLKKGKHNISVEVYNAPIGTSNLINKKIFSTKDWQAPPASTVGTATTQTIPLAGVSLIDMLRFVTADFGPPGPPALATHFYTSNPNNEFIRENRFVLEGIAFKLFENSSNVPGTVDVYRLFDGPTGDHFFTTSGEEKNLAVLGGYNYEGIVGKAYSQPGPDRIEVVRYFKPSTGEHFYTTSVEEMKNLGSNGYVRESAVFYAPTAVPTTTITTRTAPTTTITTYGSGTRKDGVIYSGPELFYSFIKGYGPFIRDYSVSPKVFDKISEPDNRLPGTRVMKWLNVDFPEDGEYTVELESDDFSIVKIGGREVATTTLGNPKTVLTGNPITANITKGKYEVEITLTNIDTGGPQIFTQNPTAVALRITKMIDVGTLNQQTWYSNPMGVSAVLIPPPCPRKITGRGVISKIVVTDPGNDYNPPPEDPGGPGYPATLQLSDIQVTNGGINYNCGVDKIKIVPDNGTVVSYTCDAFGVITGVNVDQPGIGFVEYPTIYMETETGINFSAVPVFTVVRDPIGIATDKLIQVTDLVGLKQTGYVDGRPYYGSVFYENGIRYAGNYKTIGTPIPVYNTLQESITANVTTPPSAIERFGTDVTSNDPRLNIPGTPQDTTGP